MSPRKSCFVLMGFGKKTDYRSGRVLDLDKTYGIIAKAVRSCGLECMRADDLVHSGMIDKPMYERLLAADVVIADLSTSNENAIYELGVRHALRPARTIVLAERGFKFPFDLSHVRIRTYEHLGAGIDYQEAARLHEELRTAILALAAEGVDSPVYTLLPTLRPPSLAGSAAGAGETKSEGQGDRMPPLRASTEKASKAAARASTRTPSTSEPQAGAATGGRRHAAAGERRSGDAEGDTGDRLPPSTLLADYHRARDASRFEEALRLIMQLLEISPRDPYLIQQRALATYKRQHPTALEALRAAREILLALAPETSGDPETLGLWGAIHKRLFEETAARPHLEVALQAYERGFVLRRDPYNGINLAFVLNQRARLQADPDDGTADRILARRVRRQVLELAAQALAALPRGEDGGYQDPAAAYWTEATRLEALYGLGERQSFEREKERVLALAPAAWMRRSTQEQLARLAEVL